jgi:hypothetical protein
MVRSIFKVANDLPIEVDGKTGHTKTRKLYLTPKAEQEFDAMFEWLERKLRKPGGQEQLKSHMGKFRGTIIKLALILAFCEDTRLTEIPTKALHQAIKLTQFYSHHAVRIYALGQPSDLASAHELLGHIKAGHLTDGSAPRDIAMRKWKRLTTPGEIEGAIAVLCDYGFLREVHNKNTGGAPSRKLFMNPAIERKVLRRVV